MRFQRANLSISGGSTGGQADPLAGYGHRDSGTAPQPRDILMAVIGHTPVFRLPEKVPSNCRDRTKLYILLGTKGRILFACLFGLI